MKKEFTKELSSLLNRHSVDNSCNMPDYILAEYVARTLDGLVWANQKNDEWHGRDSRNSVTDAVSRVVGLEETAFDPDSFTAKLVDIGRKGMERLDTPEYGEFREVMDTIVETLRQNGGEYAFLPRQSPRRHSPRIVFDLHDDKQQTLFSLAMSAGNTYPVILQADFVDGMEAGNRKELEECVSEMFRSENIRLLLFQRTVDREVGEL